MTGLRMLVEFRTTLPEGKIELHRGVLIHITEDYEGIIVDPTGVIHIRKVKDLKFHMGFTEAEFQFFRETPYEPNAPV